MLSAHYQNAGHTHDIKIAHRSSKNLSQFKFLEMTNKSKFDSEGN
jgi:hypothetical protein